MCLKKKKNPAESFNFLMFSFETNKFLEGGNHSIRFQVIPPSGPFNK